MALASLIYAGKKYWNNALRTPEEIRNMSETLFRRMLLFAWDNTEFYPSFYAKSGIERGDLAAVPPEKLPVLTKDIVRTHTPEIATVGVVRTSAGRYRPSERGVFTAHTSGSTGKPCDFMFSKSMLTAVEGNFVRLVNLGGCHRVGWKDLPIKSLHAASVGEGYADVLLLDKGLNKYHAQSVSVNTSDPLESWLGTIGDFKPNFISGYPSCISLLADLQNSGRLDIHPIKMITGGEPITPEQKKSFVRTFGCDIIDFYGCTEGLLLGAGSSWYEGIYLFDDMNYCETDVQGRLIFTQLHNKAFPLIRYRLSDIMEGFCRVGESRTSRAGAAGAGNESSFSCDPDLLLRRAGTAGAGNNKTGCTDVLPFTHIDRVAGREEDLLWFKNSEGNPDFLHPLQIDELDAPGLIKLQFVKTGEDSFNVDCLVKCGSETSVKTEMKAEVRKILNDKAMENVRFDIRCVDELYRDSRTGKIPVTVSRDG